MHDVKDLKTDAVIVGFHEDVRPLKGTAGALDWLLCGALSHLIIRKKMRGVLGEVALLTSKGKVPADKIFMVGLGPRAASSPESLRAAARVAAASSVNAGIAHAALDFFLAGAAQSDDAIAAVREGLAEGAGAHPIDFALLAPDNTAFEQMSRFVRA
jgi:Cytosol aminopeptidase family, N-terminal domain